MLRSLVHQNQHVLVGEAVSVAKEKKIIMNGWGDPCSDMLHTDRGAQGASHRTHAGSGEGEEARLHRVLTADGVTGGRSRAVTRCQDIKNRLRHGSILARHSKPTPGRESLLI